MLFWILVAVVHVTCLDFFVIIELILFITKGTISTFVVTLGYLRATKGHLRVSIQGAAYMAKRSNTL